MSPSEPTRHDMQRLLPDGKLLRTLSVGIYPDRWRAKHTLDFYALEPTDYHWTIVQEGADFHVKGLMVLEPHPLAEGADIA